MDDDGRMEYLKVGNTYTVVSSGWDDSNRVAGPDFVLQDIDSTFSIRRFKLAPTGPLDLSDWRTWRDHGLQPGECVCRTPKELCDYHRDT